jgi:hypothetical protein
MAATPSREVLQKVRKLARLPEEVRQSKWAVSVTRLTSLNSLCEKPEVANRFVTYLARKTVENIEQGKGHSAHPKTPADLARQCLMSEAVNKMDAWIQEPSIARRQGLLELLSRIRDEQNEHQAIKFGTVRLIRDWDLLQFEYALEGLLNPGEAGWWSYQMARYHAERYTTDEGTGLISSSAPLVQDIADFWIQEVGLDKESINAPARARKKTEGKRPSKRASTDSPAKPKRVAFTYRQGQYLAFIHSYWKMHRQAPAELDLVKYFRVTPPSAHLMIVKLAQLGLITKTARVPRSIRVAIPEEEIPELEGVEGRAW